jgi:hypothetical protein
MDKIGILIEFVIGNPAKDPLESRIKVRDFFFSNAIFL